MLKYLLFSEKGSVMLEFCLVLPIYLLIFGGTFLIFDISMGKLHLQESNRNLAWIQDDRFNDENKLINKELYIRATAYYDARNKLEKQWDVQDFWSFGEKKTYTDNKGNDVEEYDWGHKHPNFNENDIVLNADNDFLTLYTGNMHLKMDKVSAVYIGAVGVSSVLFPAEHHGKETVPLYKAAYTFTRNLAVEDGKVTDKVANVNPEMIIIRRTGADTREKVVNPNSLLTVLYRTWPYSDNIIENARLILGL